MQCSIKLCNAVSSVAYRCCCPPWAFPPRLGPPCGAAPFLPVRSMFQIERWLMLPLSLNPVAQLSCEALRLGCEAYSLIGLRLFKMATGGVPALPEALRMGPRRSRRWLTLRSSSRPASCQAARTWLSVGSLLCIVNASATTSSGLQRKGSCAPSQLRLARGCSFSVRSQVPIRPCDLLDRSAAALLFLFRSILS